MILNIIQLPHRKDRMESLKNELITQEISDYQIWGGILDKEKSFKGIAQAHKLIVRWARDQNMPKVMIAEDDIKFTTKGALSGHDFVIFAIKKGFRFLRSHSVPRGYDLSNFCMIFRMLEC